LKRKKNAFVCHLIGKTALPPFRKLLKWLSRYDHLNGNQSAWRIFNNHLCFFLCRCNVLIRGVRRIGLTSLNPMVCLSSQSETGPIRRWIKQSDPKKNVYKIRSDAKFVIRSDLKLLYTAYVNYSVYERIFSWS
jgi:hypothetical protein